MIKAAPRSQSEAVLQAGSDVPSDPLPGTGIAGHVRLSFRLNSWTWRLNGIELPDLLVRQLADELLKRPVKRSADPTSSGP